MSVDVAIHIFDLLEVELQEYDLTCDGLLRYVADLGQRLDAVGAVVDNLRGDGWAVKIVRNNLEARHPEVNTYAEAVDRLNRLPIEGDAIADIAAEDDLDKRLTPV